MKNSWILDVLEDLRTFAEGNDLPVLAKGIADAERIALIELAEHADSAGDLGPDDAEAQCPARPHSGIGVSSRA